MIESTALKNAETENRALAAKSGTAASVETPAAAKTAELPKTPAATPETPQSAIAAGETAAKKASATDELASWENEGGALRKEPQQTSVTNSPALKGIPNAARLSDAEQATAARLQSQTGLKLRESEHVGAEYIDEAGKTYDALGTPQASKYWNERQFLRSIDSHLRKSNDYTVIDLTGFKKEQIEAVQNHIQSLPKEAQDKIKRVGF